jgi:hypothetical protein
LNSNGEFGATVRRRDDNRQVMAGKRGMMKRRQQLMMAIGFAAVLLGQGVVLKDTAAGTSWETVQ